MSKIYISYFLLLTYLSLLIFKYLCEKTIIEKFQELPQIDGNDLRLLSRYAHSFVKGEPFKVNNPLSAPQFYIGTRKITIHDTPHISINGKKMFAPFENGLAEKKTMIGDYKGALIDGPYPE
jgi:hypothetical protein